VELPVEDLPHDAAGQPDQVVVGGGTVERRDARHDVNCTSPIRIARAARARAGDYVPGSWFIAVTRSNGGNPRRGSNARSTWARQTITWPSENACCSRDTARSF